VDQKLRELSHAHRRATIGGGVVIDWATFGAILASTSVLINFVLLVALMRVLNRDRRDTTAVTFMNAERAGITQHLVAEWDRALRGYERGRVTQIWPGLARHLDDLTRAR
jgi:hypothetical protein